MSGGYKTVRGADDRRHMAERKCRARQNSRLEKEGVAGYGVRNWSSITYSYRLDHMRRVGRADGGGT